MIEPYTSEQAARYEDFKAFATAEVAPRAETWDREQIAPVDLLPVLAKRGYFGSNLPAEFGGRGWDTVTFGLLCEALGRCSSSLAVHVTVQTMVSMALLKWGTTEQKAKWLPPLASGKLLGAFAITEPGAGSAIESITTEFSQAHGSDDLVLNGSKKWISCGQTAGVFLVFGKSGQQAVACLVPRESSGLQIEPLQDMLGFRGAGLAELHFQNVKIPAANVVGKRGFALSHVAPVSLHYGRISTACSALGLMRACFEESIAYAATRKVGDNLVGQLGIIRSLIANMGTGLEAGKLLCYEACRAADDHSPDAFEQALVAKYFTSRAAVAAASDAVQIRGASGCQGSSPVSRYYRDAKIMEIIEGTTQVHEQLLGKMFVNRANRLIHQSA